MSKSKIVMGIVFVLSFLLQPLPAGAGAAARTLSLKATAEQALQALYITSPKAAALGKEAKAILVFPRVVKAGFMVGVSRGEGVLLKKGEVAGYYRTTSGSWGPQAGI